jgi:hypothetical protein
VTQQQTGEKAMSQATPPHVRLPERPTAAVKFASKTAGTFTLGHRVQAEGLDEFDLEAARDSSALTGANGHRSRARRVMGELKTRV